MRSSEYESPVMEIVDIEKRDIICESPGTDTSEDGLTSFNNL